MKLVYKQVFYSSTSALEVELSKNGIFFSIANCLGKNENNNFTYNWKEKNISKISCSELCHLLEGLQAFRLGKEYYEEKSLELNNGKYKNYQFPHKSKKGTARIGWQLYDTRIQYIIKNDRSSFYTVQTIDIAKLERFLEYLINMSFHFNAVDSAEWSNTNSDDEMEGF